MSTLAQRVYYAAPIAVQNAFVTAYGFLRARKRYGGNYRRLLEEARHVWNLDDAAREALQLARLREILTYARERVPYYRETFRKEGFEPDALTRLSDLRHLPILTKEAVRRHISHLRSQGTRPFWTNETSGSTGTPLTVGLSADAYRLTMALVAVHEEDHGILPGDRRATFAGRLVQPVERDSPPFWRFNWAERQMLCSAYHLSDANMLSYLDAIERFRPVEIIGYPSAIAAVASFCRRLGHRPRLPLKAVITNSETLLEWQRDVIEDTFRCRVFDYYGTAEAVVFAGQCTAGRYHPHPLIGCVEVLDDNGLPAPPGTFGRLICTSLCNYVMPLIRYEVGDLVAPADSACPCGRPGPTWSAVIGRIDDEVVTPEGHRVGRLDHVFKGLPQIREAQILQTSPTGLIIRVVPDRGYSENVARLLVDNVRQRVGSLMTVDVQHVDAIPRTERGKFRAVVNSLRHQG